MLRKYSPCSLKLVRVALPSGAHFQIASATHTRVLPVRALRTTRPVMSVAMSCWSLAFAFNTESPARQLLLSPKSPPACAVSAPMPAPLRPVSVPGKLWPRPSSPPSAM